MVSAILYYGVMQMRDCVYDFIIKIYKWNCCAITPITKTNTQEDEWIAAGGW
jgi:hypothetical protein